MFERFTERARRVIFFARYEASRFGSTTIESEHFLLGLVREDTHTVRRFLPAATSIETIRNEIEANAAPRERTSTFIDMPLSSECKRILAHSAEEAEHLGHRHIGTEHLLLGILRESGCFAEQLLTKLGVELKTAQDEVLRAPAVPEEPIRDAGTIMPASGVVPDIDTAKRIAEAVWLPRIPAADCAHIVALDAELKYGVWIVKGSHTSNDIPTTLAAFIQKEDGKILRLHQEKANS